MPIAFITGASGFIGRHLASRLVSDGWQIRCLVRSTSSVEHLKQLDAELVNASLDDESALATAISGCDALFHVAGATRAFKPDGLYRVNEKGTATLVQAASGQGSPPVLVAVSSLAACGPSPIDRPHTEEVVPQPISHYGRSKRAGEVAIEAAADKMAATIIRPGIVFGQHNREGLPMFNSIRKFGLHAVPGMGRCPRISLLHVTDLVELVCRAAERGTRIEMGPGEDKFTGQGYYFASDAEVPDYRQLGCIIATACQSKWMIPIPIPRPLMWTVAVASETIARFQREPTIVNRDKCREAFAGNWAASGNRAQRELAFFPAATLSERLQETVGWYQEQGWL